MTKFLKNTPLPIKTSKTSRLTSIAVLFMESKFEFFGGNGRKKQQDAHRRPNVAKTKRNMRKNCITCAVTRVEDIMCGN